MNKQVVFSKRLYLEMLDALYLAHELLWSHPEFNDKHFEAVRKKLLAIINKVEDNN